MVNVLIGNKVTQVDKILRGKKVVIFGRTHKVKPINKMIYGKVVKWQVTDDWK